MVSLRFQLADRAARRKKSRNVILATTFFRVSRIYNLFLHTLIPSKCFLPLFLVFSFTPPNILGFASASAGSLLPHKLPWCSGVKVTFVCWDAHTRRTAMAKSAHPGWTLFSTPSRGSSHPLRGPAGGPGQSGGGRLEAPRPPRAWAQDRSRHPFHHILLAQASHGASSQTRGRKRPPATAWGQRGVEIGGP